MLKKISNVELSPLIRYDSVYFLESWFMRATLIVTISALMNPDSNLHYAEVWVLLKMHVVV